MKEQLLSLIRQYKYRDAFWQAAPHVAHDVDCRDAFLRVCAFRSSIRDVYEDIDKVREMADAGNPYMQYAYARLHDFFPFANDSLQTCVKYYEDAADNGIADASACLAWLEAAGAFGEKNLMAYHEMIDKAMAEGSRRAAFMKLSDMIYGNHEVKKDPEKARQVLLSYVSACLSSDKEMPYMGYLYTLIAFSYEQTGDREKAEDYYVKAADEGMNSAYYDLALLVCFDDEGQLDDPGRFEELMQQAEDAGDTRCFMGLMFVVSADDYDDLDEENQKLMNENLLSDLNKVWQTGESLGAYFLGDIYEHGYYGFDQDYAEAFALYARGATMYDQNCYERMARMIIEDGTAPESYSKDFGYEAAYRALILGADTRDLVVSGYKQGYLTSHAAAIEQYYLNE